MKQIVLREYATLRQRLRTRASLTTEKQFDMNGSWVSNGHPTVNGGQANDQLNGHLAAQANGHSLGRNHASVTDTAYPVFSKTLAGHRRLTETGSESAAEEPKQNAEVYAHTV